MIDYNVDPPKPPLSGKTRRMIFKTTLLVIFTFFLFLIVHSINTNNNQKQIKANTNYSNVIPKIKKSPPQERINKISGKIKPNTPIINLFTKHQFTASEVLRMIKQVKPIYNLRYIRAGNKFELVFNNANFQTFKYYIDDEKYLLIKKQGNNYKGSITKIPYVLKEEIIIGKITNSLFNAILKINEKSELADLLATLFEYDIDFNRDIRKGDSFSIILDKKYLNGKFIKYGALKACNFINQGTKISILRYTDPNGKTSYYHPNGKAVKKMFLRCPLPFMRVTSSYGIRKHPILKFTAKHNGLDLGAKTGTVIRTTASGTILKKGYSRTKGKYIVIRHPNKYYTNYYHLSRFAKTIRVGKKVTQSQLIGYVGSTGLSSGPHLHYGIKKGNKFINPLRFNSPSNPSVQKVYLKDFYKTKNRLITSLDSAFPIQTRFSPLSSKFIVDDITF